MFQILIVEDDRELRELFCTVLSEQGYQVTAAPNGVEALELMEHQYIDLMITDVMMPHMDGYELIRQLRSSGYTLPILVITVRGNIADKKEGFRAGTDDYMVKPVDVNEMVWRVEALLRRAHSVNTKRLSIGGTTLQYDALTVTYGDQTIEVPQKEFYLLFKLLSTPGKIFTRRQLCDEIWGMEAEVDPHTLDVHISRLRDRFRNNTDFSIVTVRGLGYKAVKQHE